MFRFQKSSSLLISFTGSSVDLMPQKIIIIGGGISGLTALYYLRKKYAPKPDIVIRLLEKESTPGGTIKTIERETFRYETGPNGFLDNKPSTLELARELGLGNELITASPATKIRFICVKNVLYPLPSGVKSFFNFKPLRFRDKLRVAKEFFVARGTNSEETVYEFGTRRLGEEFSKYFLDPMASGIFGGDAKNLNLKYAFPRIYQIEQEYGSLFKGMIALGLIKRQSKKKNSLGAGQPKGQLWSFKNGMGQLTEKLAVINKDFIETDAKVEGIFRQSNGYRVKTPRNEYFADKLVMSVPAFCAADLLKNVHPNLSAQLLAIPYAPIIVVGLAYDKKQFEQLPQGFGYLRPTHEKKEVLGVVFSSNIFSGRVPDEKILFQIMLGGFCHPDITQKSDDEIFALAKTEIATLLKPRGKPFDQFLLRWPKAIPQYTRQYPQSYKAIKGILSETPNLYWLPNYLEGISLNDCTTAAKQFSENWP